MRAISTIIHFLLFCLLAKANVEKVIFVVPELGTDVQLASYEPRLNIDTLSRSHQSLRSRLLARWPHTPASWTLSETWILLEDLREGGRYEIRVCWSATQSTTFNISVHGPAAVLTTPALNSSLYEFVAANDVTKGTTKHLSINGDQRNSTPLSHLYLHISATADYFSTNATLMKDGLMVDIDIVLDPYLLNILPESLAPTAIYLVVLTILAWFLSGFIWQWLSSLVQSDGNSSGRVSHNQDPNKALKKTN